MTNIPHPQILRRADSVRVVAIVLNWNGIEWTRRCIRKLLDSRDVNLRVMVMDNASAGAEAERLSLEFPQCTIVQNGLNYGYAEGNNLGIRAGVDEGADYILILNNDVEVEAETVAALVACAEMMPIAAAVGPIVREPDGNIQSAGAILPPHMGMPHVLKHPLSQMPYTTGYVSGACILMRSAAVKSIGPFDPAYFLYGEERDWCLRAQRAGWAVLVEPRTAVTHHESTTTGSISGLKTYFVARNSVLFARKHARGFARLIFPIIHAHRLLQLFMLGLRNQDLYGFRCALRGTLHSLRVDPGKFVPFNPSWIPNRRSR